MGPLDALEIFVVVYERGSFTAAARSLGLDPSVVSRRIRALERSLRAPLFHRTTRAMTPTDAATAFYERVAPALAEIREARLELGDGIGGLRGVLRVAAPGALGRVRVAPIAHAFAEEHPEVVFDLRFSDRQQDLIRERIDLAIRVGSPSQDGQIVRRLGLSEQWIVAAPRYLERHPADARLEDHRVLLPVFGGRVLDLRPWLGPAATKLDVRMISDDLSSLADAVRAGLGLAGLPRWLVEPDVERGALVRLPLLDREISFPIYAVLVHGRHTSRRAHAFLEALVRALGDPTAAPTHAPDPL